MKEIIVGVLIITTIVIIWDLTKVILSRREKEEIPIIIGDPGKESILNYAQSFKHLANVFSNMPYRKEHLSNQDMELVFEGVSNKLCSHCERAKLCLKQNQADTYQVAYEILNTIEESGKDIDLEVQEQFARRCIHSRDFLEEMVQTFQRAKLNLMWNNKLMENRVAVSEQLNEMSNILTGVAQTVYEMKVADTDLEMEIKRILRRQFILVKHVCISTRLKHRQEIFITMKSAKGRCVHTKEIAIALAKVCEQPMIPVKGSRNIVNQEYSTILFVEDTHFQVLNGVARVTKEGETISGDNFAFMTKDSGQVFMSLSDGMGSGVPASKESETVIELLEQFLESGFKKETAVKMINSAMVVQSAEKSFSTIDICTIDLYSGMSEFLKIGASATLIKRDHWVEVITSTSLPAGILHQVDYDSSCKKLFNGDFVIMVSDGILDALPENKGEEILKEIILQVQTTNANEMAKNILERVLVYNHCKRPDDMTVLVGGIWKK
jgi:Serine phosphatase RsbU, regulator of sigma subunit